MLRRSGLKPKAPPRREAKQIDYTPRPRAPAQASAALITPPRPVPKAGVDRSQAYRDLARGRPCMMALPGVCCADPATTVLAHSNRSIHGKGGALKASDAVGAVWACWSCHAWLDSGSASAAQKEAAHEAAFGRQVAALEALAADILARSRDREAARWALERIAAFSAARSP
jgi:hypothetical protein